MGTGATGNTQARTQFGAAALSAASTLALTRVADGIARSPPTGCWRCSTRRVIGAANLKPTHARERLHLYAHAARHGRPGQDGACRQRDPAAPERGWGMEPLPWWAFQCELWREGVPGAQADGLFRRGPGDGAGARVRADAGRCGGMQHVYQRSICARWASTTTTRCQRSRPRSFFFRTGFTSTFTRSVPGRVAFWCRCRSSTRRSPSRRSRRSRGSTSCSSGGERTPICAFAGIGSTLSPGVTFSSSRTESRI